MPLLKLELGTGWARSLDEFATGLDGRVSISEVETHFGKRWRLLVADPLERSQLGNHYSTRSPIYRAFSTEIAQRGATVGDEGIVKEVKAKYRGIKGGSSALYKQANIDFPAPKQCKTLDSLLLHSV